MARDDDDDIIMLWSAAVLLETRRKRKHSVWINSTWETERSMVCSTHCYQNWLQMISNAGCIISVW